MDLLTISRYAIHRGVSLAAVQKAIASGRIRPIFDENNNVRIDAVAADKEWDANSQLHFRPDGLANDLQSEIYRERTQDTNQMKFSLPGDGRDESTRSGSGSQITPGEGLTYTEARTQREIYEAKLAQLEYEHRVGKMVLADELRDGIYNAAKLTREALLNIPNRLSSQLSLETDSTKIHTLLTTEIHQALEELSRAHS